MLRNIFFMSISTFVRLLSGVVLFVVLARILGPDDFGRLMYSFSLASLSTLLVDYGFTIQILKKVGENPNRVKEIMGQILLAKLILGAVLVLTCVFVSELIGVELADRRLYQMMLIAAICRSFGDFMNVAFRGLECFQEESKIVSSGMFIHFVVIFTIAILGGSLSWIAFGFIVSRIVYLLLSWRTYNRVTGGFCYPQGIGVVAISETLRKGFPFAADVGLVTSIQHVDTLLVNHYLGPTAVGIYKAGMNLVRGLESFAQVLANVYLPPISRCSDKRLEFGALARKLNIQLIATGVMCVLVFVFGSKWITAILYGGRFAELSSLWSYFALFLLFRFVAVTQGILLTASGLQYMRVWGLLVVFFTLLLISPLLIGVFELAGMILSQLVAVAMLTIFYIFVLMSRKVLTGFSLASGLMGISALLLIVLTLTGIL